MTLSASATTAFKAAQARWLQARNSCCADKTCLANSYRPAPAAARAIAGADWHRRASGPTLT
jgi:uncharacterized protein